jgi:hypothetical protein
LRLCNNLDKKYVGLTFGAIFSQTHLVALPGANPTIESYSASAVKVYDASSNVCSAF